MSYRTHFERDVQERTQNLPIHMALTQETIDERKKDREDLNNITTRRLTSIWMCKMLSITHNWHPGVISALQCYDYINQLICNIKNHNITSDYCIPNEYCDYFLTTDPDIIKRIIQDELRYHLELWSAHHND